jgi:N-acetylmuramoyl-L-alanine amidase
MALVVSLSLRLAVAVLLLWTPPAASSLRATSAPADLAIAAAAAVTQELTAAPAPTVRLLDASLAGRRLTLNFSRELHELGPGSLAFEQFSRRIHRAAAEVLRADFTDFEIHTHIAGAPLHELLAPADTTAISRPLRAPDLVPAPGTAALTARRIAISPGHGYYLNTSNAWVLQRGYWQGIVEDFVNHDMITLVRDELAALGATVLPTRNLDRTAGNGESGFPKWQEAARYHVKALGADPSIWNEPGFTHLDQDIRTRPRWANSVNADLLVSLHNNGGGGTGTETLYDTNNGFGPESKRLADAVHARVIAAIRRDYNATWADRRVQGFNGSYGENRLATRPAILIEVAFMDRPTPDNAALQDEAFKRLVARAIREGAEDYFNGPAAVAPAAPSTLIATTAANAVRLTWTDLATNEAGFRVERRSAGAAAWETVATTGPNITTHTDSTITAGTTYVYRIVAYNAVGSSPQFSNEATIGPAPAPATPVAHTGAWLANLSLRTALAAGQTVTVGFVVAGGARDVLVRVAGPTLGQFGVSAALADPRLELYRDQTRLTDNNDWPATLAPAMAALGAFPFTPSSRDAALLQPLAGAHTVVAAGPTAGAILVEGYDAGTGGPGRIVNLSARNRVGPGGELLIAGFYVAGTGTHRVLIRAVGPTLTVLGVPDALADPKLEIFDSTGSKIAEDDNWNPALASTFASVAAFPLPAGSRDAALLLTLAAGRSYTAQVSGVGSASGEALVEVYELP